MVKVYHARVTDAERAEAVVTRHKGSAEWIAMLPGGEIIPQTVEEVDPLHLDGQGRYSPKIERRSKD